jgi:hypothetical protein
MYISKKKRFGHDQHPSFLCLLSAHFSVFMARQTKSTAAAAPKAKSSRKKIPMAKAKALQKVAENTTKKIAVGSADGDDNEEDEGSDDEDAKWGAKGVSIEYVCTKLVVTLFDFF